MMEHPFRTIEDAKSLEPPLLRLEELEIRLGEALDFVDQALSPLPLDRKITKAVKEGNVDAVLSNGDKEVLSQLGDMTIEIGRARREWAAELRGILGAKDRDRACRFVNRLRIYEGLTWKETYVRIEAMCEEAGVPNRWGSPAQLRTSVAKWNR